jgi:YHS domain-containing protein
MTIDPVCDMSVNDTVALKTTYQGKTYYFCSPLCKNLFEREPEKYVAAKGEQGIAHLVTTRPDMFPHDAG